MSAPQDGEPEHPANRLVDETSPYLLQHAHNPVEWYPWGPEALEKAKAENKPIFLSIGYSACHWCHVMEHESFENPRIARIMNEHFVCIKVDREERPDIDEIYMKFVQQTTGSGGWPMSVFLTPDRQPFYGGTYFPPTRQWGRPGFDDLLTMMAQGWENDRKNILEHAGRFRASLEKEAAADTSSALSDNIVQSSAVALLQNHDSTWGGFGTAPKFPHSMDLRVLLRHWQGSGDRTALSAVRLTLDRMSQGGAYDQLGGGFHRYSVDEKWLIPHFEKMLYDNALLVPVYLEMFQITGEDRYARVAVECCDWVLREMVTAEGGFASTQDADSEGEEGKFFAWTPDEIFEHLGREAGEIACSYWGVTDEGNFEHGKSALWREFPDEHVASLLDMEVGPMLESIEASRTKLFEVRKTRVAPGTDDKVLAAWNGMMISAMAQTWQVLGDDRYLEAARNAARYVLEGMRQEDGRLYATARNGRAHLNAYLDDYAFMIAGLLDLYESDFDPAWLRHALELEEIVAERFLDKERGGYYTTGSNHEELLARIKSPHDGALPSGNSVQALNLLRLAELCGKPEFAKGAERTMLSVGRMVNNYPAAFSQLVLAADFIGAKPREVVIAGELDCALVQDMLAALRTEYLPQKVVALADARADRDLVPLLREREPGDEGARAYVCRNYTCKLPVESTEAMLEQLREE